MIRTQVYLPEELHSALKKLAQMEETSFSHLIRDGTKQLIQRKLGKSPQHKALKFFANPPGKYRLNISGKKAVQIIRKDRDQ